MIVIRGITSLSHSEIRKQIETMDAVVVDVSEVSSLQQVKLAEHLAKKAFAAKKNIAKKLKYEFLLLLSGKNDLASAFKQLNPKGNKFFVIIFSGKKETVMRALGACEIKLGLENNADQLVLESISLSR